MTKQEQVFIYFFAHLMQMKLKYHIYISIQTFTQYQYLLSAKGVEAPLAAITALNLLGLEAWHTCIWGGFSILLFPNCNSATQKHSISSW
jgi:hypothetical protein